MKRLITLFSLVICLAISLQVGAQSTANYTYSTVTTGSLTLDKDGNTIDMSSGTTELYGANIDSYTAVLQSLGFDFVFMGVPYTQFSANPDGAIRLGSTLITGHTVSPALNAPFMTLINIDNKTGPAGKVHYKAQSGTGGQVLIIEWKDILINWLASGTTLSTFQLRLYQASGIIEMVYGQMWNSSTSSMSGSIWFASSNVANTIGQLNTITTTPTYNSSATTITTTSFTASSAMTNLHSTTDGSRRVFTFTPPTATPAAPTALNFSNITGTSMTLNWTDNSSDETGFAILRSTDGINYTYIGSVAANVVTYEATGLSFGTTYYWNVHAVNEGKMSAPASGTQATNAPTLSGIKTVPGDFATIAAAVNACNTQGIIPGGGGVTFNVAAGHTETISAPISLTATGTSADPIIFQKSGAGANPIITAYTGGTGTPGTAVQDGIWNLVGSDYVTIDGIDLSDPNSTNPATMEYGFAFFKASISDGCQNNIIKNCVVTLSRVNNASGSGPSLDGSRGINVANSTVGAQTTALTPSSASGTNSYNRFYTNTIQNCNIGIALSGFAASSPFTLGDTDNDVGGSSGATGNTILNFGGGGTTNPAAGIRANHQWNVNISYNVVNNNNGSGVNHASTLRGIYAQAGTSANANINNNIITIHGGATTSQVAMIENAIGSTAAGNTVNINNNELTGSYLTATSGAFYGIYSTSSPATVNINGNIINNLSYSASGLAGSGALYPIYHTTGTATNVNVNYNTIGNITRTGTTGGTTIAIYVNAGTNQTVTFNNISNMSIDGSGSSSIMYGIQTVTGTVVVNNNTIHTLSCVKTTGTGALYGIYNIASPTNENYNHNTIYNLTHNGTGTVYGIFASTTTGTRTLSNNTIHTITGAGTTIAGVNNASSSPNVFKNKIYNIQSTSTGAPTVSGIIQGSLGTSGTANIYNNLIGDIKAPNASSSGPAAPTLRGINITTATTTSNVNVYYNTVYLNASTTGTNFSTAALFVTTSTTATTAALTLRNNIFVNKSTPAGTGLSVAYQRSSSALANYTSASNNNLFYAGTPGAANLIFYDGTPTQTMTAFQTLVAPREASSFTEDPTFLSTTGSSTNFLHISTTVQTQIESGGASIAGITDDYDGDIRFGETGYAGTGTAPDVGADEFNGIGIDLSAPAISYTLLGNGVVAATRPFPGVNITDASGVNTASGTAPRVYYKRSTDANAWNDNTSSTDGWKWKEANGTSTPFDFTIDYSLLNGGTGINPGDVIQYFVVAQDQAGTPNVGINTGTFAAAPASVALTTAAFPIGGTLNSYTIVASISGTKTVGSGGDYPSLTGAGGLFADINAKVVTGNIIANVVSNLTEDGANALNQWSESGAGNYTLTIQPDGTTERVVSGAVANHMIRLNSADRVIIDGRYNGTGKYLRFRNTNTSNAVLQFLNGAADNTLRNAHFEGASTSTANGVIFFSTGDNTGNTILDCEVRDRSDDAGRPYNGIYFAATTNNNNNVIKSNIYNFSQYGVHLSASSNTTVDSNRIYQNTPSTLSTVYGIYIGNTPGTKISRNYIFDLGGSSTATIKGIYYFGSSGVNMTVSIENNSIALSPVTTGTVDGIDYYAYSTNSANIYFNSIYIGGTLSSGSNLSACIRKRDAAANFNQKNNALQNARANAGGTASHYAIYISNTTGTLSLDYNDYWVSGSGGVLGHWLGTLQATLSAWQTASSLDPASISADPMFVSGTNLQPMSSSPLIDAGTPITGILKDILNINRDAINPTIGAYEEGFFVPCPPPSGLQASNITTTSALLGWTPGGTEPMWSIEVGTPGFTPGTGNAILSEYYTTDNPWTASPLAPSTDYEFYVQAYCNGFENPKVDYFWMAMPSLGFLDPGQSGGTANDPDETGVWYEYEDDETSLSWWNIWFYNDPLDKNRMKKVRMGFWVQPIVAGPPSWINYVINWSDSTWVLPGFPMPADELFVVRSPLNDSVISGLTWIELLFVIPDFNPEWVSVDIWGENIQILQESTEPYPMTSPLAAYWLGPLSPGGVIVHECLPKGHNTSSWSGPKPFTTACGSVTTFPFTESFDGTTFPPACWLSQKITGSDPGTWKRVTAGTNPVCAPYSGAGMIEYDSYLYSSGTKGILVTPPLNIPNEFFKVNFWMYRSGTYSNLDSVAVFYNTAPNLEGATLLGVAHRWIGADPVVPSNGWYEFSFNFPSGATGDGRYIIFEGISRYGNDIYVDEVTISGATAPLFTANPASKDFGECPLNNLSAEYYTQSFEIRNDGPGTITLTGASIIGTNAGEFELTDLNSYNLDLTYGNPIYVSVKFNPATVGNKSATLRFSSPSRADYDIPLAGAAYVAPAQNLTGQTTAAYTNELQWDPPMPEGEIRFDNGIASGFWWVANPSTANHYFFTRFTAPISGNLDFVAFFTRKSSGGPNWNQVLVCPEIGTTNTPDLANPIATFSGVTVTSTTGEWIILELSPSASLSNGDDFFLVTRWPEGSTAGPFIAADATSNFGRCAYTDDSGTNWYNANTSWLMRAYMSVAARETIALTSGIANPQLENLPVIAASEVTKPEWAQKVTNLSVPVPGIFVSNTGQRALLSYDVLRGTAANSLTALATGVPDTEYDDNDPNLVPGTQYFYGVIAVYTGSQLSDTSNVIGLTLSPSPGITYTPLANTHLTTARTLTATIIGKGGVPQSGTGLPVCYWKKGQGGSWTGAWGVHDSGDLYNFSFGSGVTGGDTVYYYVVAQDNGTPPNVLANPSAGAGGYSAHPPAAATPPTAPNSYRITDSYSGNLKVGTGEQFESLTGAAGLFASINNAVVTGNITVEITTNLTEPGTVGLNQWTEITDGTYSLTIKPDAAVNRTISGNYAGALIRLNGADGVIIDGSYGGGGRYLTFENLDASNSNITIALSNNANNNSILNCNIYSKYRAVTLTSTSTTTIEGNNIYGDVAGNSNYYQTGIYLYTNSLNTIIKGNTIHDFYYNGTDGWGVTGIWCETGSAATETQIINNLIYNIKADGFTTTLTFLYWNPHGIYIANGGNIKIYNNSIYLSGNVLSGSQAQMTGCITIMSGVTLLDIRNNILQNSLQPVSGTPASKTYAIITTGTNAQFTSINHNDYYVNGIGPNVGYLGSDRATLAAWQTATGQDGKSIAADPLYLGTTNLQLQTSPQSPAIGKAIPILPLVGKDYAGNTRNPIKPTMGAYDYNPADFFTWTGTTDTDWNTSTNWSPATVPGLNDDAYVPPVPSGNPLNFPIVPVSGGPFSVDELYVGPGASVTVPDGATLNVKNTNP